MTLTRPARGFVQTPSGLSIQWRPSEDRFRGVGPVALRESVLRGGLYLSAREGIGFAAGIVGILLLTRIIGPIEYGIYRVALEVVAYFAGVARLGLDAYLVRRSDSPSRQNYNQVFSTLLIGSLLLMAIGYASLGLLGTWLGDARYLPPLRILLTTLPFTVLSIPALAMLERDLDYRKVAGLETSGKLIYHGTAVLLALCGWGFWGAVAGYMLWQTWLTVGSCILARYVPRWSYSWSATREMITYGVGYSSSIWVFELRSLVNPLVIGRYLGPQYVGYVSLTTRLVEVIGFVKTATSRLSLVVLGKVQDETRRLKSAVEEALALQALAMGAPLALFAISAPPLLPRLIGGDWSPSLQVFPFVSLGYMMSAFFGVHASVLYVRKKNLAVAVAYTAHVLLFTTTAFLLVRKIGLWGYCWAEIVALISYSILHVRVGKLLKFSYERAVPWLLAFPPILFLPILGWPRGLLLFIPAALALLSPSARRQIREYRSFIRERVGEKKVCDS
jgi:O-antigen/teichoic acid export membrane protein